MTLRCATSNAGKLREFRLAGERFGVAILPLEDLADVPPCEEDGETFEANAVKKALYYSGFTEDPVFADDSGLAVDALDGAPGARSARFSPEGNDAANNSLLVERMRGVEDRRGRFICVIALAQGGRLLRTFRGAVEGRILDAARGSNGFGYDPLFYCPELGCTFGEADDAMKMRVSHRGQALNALLEFAASTMTSR